MYVGLCRMTLAIPGNRSLKGKRHVVRRVTERIRHKFHAAAAEVGDPERWNEAEVGFSVVSGNERHARSMAEAIISFIDGMMLAPLREVELDIIAFDDVATGATYEVVERWREGEDAKLGELASRKDDEG